MGLCSHSNTYCWHRVLLKTVLSAEGQTGKLLVTNLNHSNGTSALTTLEMNFPGKTDLTFAMQCMGGSCIKRDQMPKDMAELVKGEPIVNQPMHCTGFDPIPAGADDSSSGDHVRLAISLICIGFFAVAFLYGIFIFIEVSSKH